MDLSNYEISEGTHHGKNVIWISFPYSTPLKLQLQAALKVRWSASRKAWFASDNSTHRQILGLEPKLVGKKLIDCSVKLRLSENHLHSRMNAVKFYFEKVLERPGYPADIPRPKKPSQLPRVVAKPEVRRMLEKVSNIKHRVLLKLCYGMGLRVGEID